MMQFGRMFQHEISIKPTIDGGAVAKIGCCTRVYGSSDAEKERMCKDFRQYVFEPLKTEELYYKAMRDESAKRQTSLALEPSGAGTSAINYGTNPSEQLETFF